MPDLKNLARGFPNTKIEKTNTSNEYIAETILMSLRRPVIESIVALSFCVALSACGSVPRDSFTVQDEQAAQVVGFPDVRVWGDGTIGDTQRAGMAPLIHARTPMNYISISGGGSAGAFGAGVMVGWTANGTRPMFDVVSGVSTGALLAPFVFLGPKYDSTLTYIYTSGITKNLAEQKFIVAGIFGNSLFEPGPLRHLVEHYATPQMLEEIAAEYVKGRRLFVVTTNLDAQRPVLWNMGKIAASGKPDALKLFQDVLIASASVPGAYPGVRIKVDANEKTFEELHVDGGTVSPFFTIPEQSLASESIPASINPSKSNIYILMNSILEPEFQITKDSTIDVASRAISTLIKAQTKFSVIATNDFAENQGLRLHIAAIDKVVPYDPENPFDPKYMRALYQLGYQRALSQHLWQESPDWTTKMCKSSEGCIN